MPFQPGNQEAKKGEKKRRFKQQLIAVLEEADGDVTKLRKVAEKLAQAALNGDVQAIKEVRDTIDGKPAQAIVGDDEHDPVNILQRIERVIVDPPNPDSEGVPPAT